MAYTVTPTTRNFIRVACVVFAVCLIFVGVSGAVPDAVDKLDGTAKTTAAGARDATKACTEAGHRATKVAIGPDNKSVTIDCAFTLFHLASQTYVISCVDGMWSRDVGELTGGTC